MRKMQKRVWRQAAACLMLATAAVGWGCAAPEAAPSSEGAEASASADEASAAAEEDFIYIGTVQTNEAGQTYGTSAAADAEGVELDLMAAEATNGRSGYVYVDELEEVGSGGVTNPDEAVAYMEQRETRGSEALAKHLTAALPEGVTVTPAQARVFLDELSVGSADVGADLAAGLADRSKRATVALAEETGIPEADMVAVLEDAYFAANDEVADRIPVYESDGKTQIGEFAMNGL